MRHSQRALALLAAWALLAAPGGAQQAQEAVAPEAAQEVAAPEVVAPDPAQEAVAPEAALVRLATASITGVYFPVGVALCRLVNQHRAETGLRCSAVPTEGSVANAEALRRGEFDLAIVQSDTAAASVAGTGPFSGAGPDAGLRSLVPLYPEPLTLVVRADAGIAQVEDLAGKRLWLGGAGSGTRSLADALVAALGWTPATFAAVPDLPTDRVADALCRGDLDGFLLATGHPALAVREATAGCGARLVPIDGGAVDALVAGHPGLAEAAIPGGLYPGNPDPTPSFGVVATLVTRADEPEDRIAQMLGQMFGDPELLRSLEPVLARFDPETAARSPMPAPLHPGAERYFDERGLTD